MLSAHLAQTLRNQRHKGAMALVRAGAAGLLGAVGLGLLTAALLMALAKLIGILWATVVLGVVFVALAALLAPRRKERRPSPPAPPPLEEIIFTLAFVAARAFSRKDP